MSARPALSRQPFFGDVEIAEECIAREFGGQALVAGAGDGSVCDLLRVLLCSLRGGQPVNAFLDAGICAALAQRCELCGLDELIGPDES
jgi:hypothetical protein